MLGRPDKHRLWRSEPLRHLTQSPVIFTRNLFDVIAGGLLAVASNVAQIREGFIQRIDREVMVIERPGQSSQGILNGHEARCNAVLLLRLFLGASYDGANAGQEQHLARVTPKLCHLGFYVAVIDLRLLQRVGVKKDRIRA